MTARRVIILLTAFALHPFSIGACRPPEVGTAPTVPAQPAEPAPETAGDAIPTDLLNELIAETERVRGLLAQHPIHAETVDDEALHDFIAREVASTELERSGWILEAFGFVPSGFDLARTMTDLLSAEVIGLYDPRSERLMVRRAVLGQLESPGQEGLMARMVLIHELTHALQDQHFDTLHDEPDEAWSDDSESARTCLVEGDATLTMLLGVISGSGGPDQTAIPGFRMALRQSGASAVPSSIALSQAPPYFAHVMAAAYLEGAAFVAELRAVGGWDAVNDAHRHLPPATRDILHTEAYLAGQPRFDPELPEEITPLTEAGYQPIISATLGELETGAFLLPLRDDDRLWSAAEGWAGDRFRLYRSDDGRLALIWRLRFVDEDEASEFFSAARDTEIASGRGPCAPVDPADEATVPASGPLWCEAGRDWLQRQGEQVLLLRAWPARDEAPTLAQAVFGAPIHELPGRALPEFLERYRQRYGASLGRTTP